MSLTNSPLSMRTKFTLAFGGLAILVLMVSALALKSLAEANMRFDSYVYGVNARVQLAGKVRTAVDARAISARNLVLITKPEELEAEKAAVIDAHALVQKSLGELKVLVAKGVNITDKARALITELEKSEQAYGPVALAIVQLAITGQQAEAITRMNQECRPLLATLVKASDEYRDYSMGRSDELTQKAATDRSWQLGWLALACLVAFGAAGLAGMVISRSLRLALGAEPGELSLVAQRLAAGDLSPVSGAQSAPATSVLASLGSMQSSLAGVVGQVRNSSDSIATGSAQIATGNANLSQRTVEQAHSLQRTAASMAQLGSTVKNNADSAVRANELASNATSAAAKGGEMVNRVVATMQDIASSSKKIVDIIGVIDGIAFQTNILALNAAVEAARAGEQGRGFAVVASEVRSLASRSAEAAKEIKQLISASVVQVENGARQVNDAGASMTEIVAQVQRVGKLIGEISTATAEQSTGIGLVGDAVARLDQVTQQNAALVEESAAEAERLKQQAHRLAEVVRVFNAGPTTGLAVTSDQPA